LGAKGGKVTKYILILFVYSLLAATQEKTVNVIEIKINKTVHKSIGNTDLETPSIKFRGIAKLDLNQMCVEQPNHIWCMKNK